jgi:hypothetical protein
VTRPRELAGSDAWRIALQCAGAGAGYVLGAHEMDEPVPVGPLSELVIDVFQEFGLDPPANVEAFAQEFRT